MMGNSLKRQIRKELNSLGRKPEAVALRLRDLGVTGYRHNGRNCPLARYLNATVFLEPNVIDVSVDRSAVRVCTYQDSFSVRLRRPLRRFVHNFDERMYPWLEPAKSVKMTYRYIK